MRVKAPQKLRIAEDVSLSDFPRLHDQDQRYIPTVAMPKRARDMQEDASSQIAPAEKPKRKKTRTSAASTGGASQLHRLAAPSKSQKGGKAAAKVKGVLIPSKRARLPGRLNKLAVPKPQSLAARKGGSGSTRPDVNRRGNKINKGWGTGGFDTIPLIGATTEDIGESTSATGKASSSKSANSVPVGAEMWITRKSSYTAYLKSGVAAFMQKG